MKSQPNRNYESNDTIMTPVWLAEKIVKHFRPSGIILEPCKGTGNFLKFLPEGSPWCEITEGVDFLKYECPYRIAWIITNPPWSKIRAFLRHSMDLAHNVVFLMTINHLWTKARLRDMRKRGFGIREIVLIDTPDGFPGTGFQLGVVRLEHFYYRGDIKLTDWRRPS